MEDKREEKLYYVRVTIPSKQVDVESNSVSEKDLARMQEDLKGSEVADWELRIKPEVLRERKA